MYSRTINCKTQDSFLKQIVCLYPDSLNVFVEMCECTVCVCTCGGVAF
uniref:Uncharacterized protein n=1 Tax=Anguilla anguilla TaxID=7936 RepID=A0A0E9U1K9_ANGAN